MIRPHTLSLHTRFALGIGAVLLPFLLAAVVGQFYLLPRLVGPLEEIVFEVTEEMRPVVALEIALLESRHAGRGYLMRNSPAARDAFEASLRRVAEALVAASPERYAAQEERAILRAVGVEWNGARGLGEALLRLADPAGKTVAMRDTEQFEAHLDRAVKLLGRLQEQFGREIDEERVKAQAAKREATFFTVAILAVALVVALGAGALLARHVLGSVDALQRASRRLGAGELSARVALDRNDEIGELARGFDAMAEQIEQHEHALEERNSRLSALNQIAVAITSSSSLRDMLEQIMRSGIDLTGVKASCIAFYDAATGHFTEWVTQGLSEHFVSNISFRPGGLADETFTRGSHVVSNDLPETRHKLSRLAREEGLRSFVCLPLTSRERHLGVIYFYRSDSDTFPPAEIELLTIFASLAAQAIENARLYAEVQERAITDALTGLFNRREFRRRLNEEMGRARRFRRPLSLLMLDIDHFKAVNDTHGHPAGDEVLRVIAARVRASLRPTDHVARYGGEEFIVMQPETTPDGALATAERIRAAIAGTAVPIGLDRAVSATISVGTASFPDNADTEEELIAAADRALYAAKESGRNRVCRPAKRSEADAR